LKIALPLWIKVWLLLALNFALVAALGTAWFLARGDAGWEKLARGPLGDRVAALADDVAEKLWAADDAEADATIAATGRDWGVTLVWLRNDGLVLAGPALPLPAAVQRELARNGPLLGGPNRRPTPEEREGDRPPARRGTSGPGAQPGRFLYEVDGNFWFGLRLHPSPEALEHIDGPPPRTTLVIQTPSRLRLAWLLGLHWWVGVAGLALGVSVLFWLPFVRSATRRLKALEAATQRIAEGRLETRTDEGTDEIGRLGGSINAMAARLESHAGQQKKFLGDVAHELGSPLGRLQVAVELLEQRAQPSLAPAVADVREEVQQMAELVGELLAFTRAGLRPREAELGPVALQALCGEVREREDPDGRSTLDVPAWMAVRADAALLRRAVGNLLRNALRYGGGAPRVSAEADGDVICLRVEDDGPGVPPEALARLGEPFFRPETARTRETGGVGLGLTIVRSSVAACGGEVRFANRVPRGFVAEIRLAKA
jgi:two-component system sensor histidine kinase CpxA